MAQTPIRFGTDGWRGRIAEDYTFDAVRRCSHGFAQFLLRQSAAEAPVVVGYDRRFASEHFAAAVAEVLAGHGFRVLLTDQATPTPAIALAVVEHHASGAVNITASHNPPGDNGFKVRDRFGGAVDPEGLKQIEAAIPASADDVPRIALGEAERQGRVVIFDPAPSYARKLGSLVDLERIRGLERTILIDPMWGNGAGWFPRLLAGGRVRVQEIHRERNPSFPEMARPEPIPPNVDPALKATRELGADALVITDGDADRVGLGDERGLFVDQLRVFALLAFYFLETRGVRGPIVKTLSTTSMLNRLGELYGVPVFETGVGFKYIAPKFREVDALIGGEESGGYAFRGHVPERDGILSGLYLLDFMARTGLTPSGLVDLLFERVGPHYYRRVDAPLPPERRSEMEATTRRAEPHELGGRRVDRIVRTDGTKFVLQGGDWLLIRFSGTEPLVRIYCETTSAESVDPLLEAGQRLVGLHP